MNLVGQSRIVVPGKPVYLRNNGAAFPKVLAKNLGLASASVDLYSTPDVSVWDATAPVWDPVTIDATNNKIDFKDAAGGAELTGTVASGLYKHQADLAAAVVAALAAAGANAYTVAYSTTTYKFTVDSDGAEFELLAATGTNVATSVFPELGFSADKTGDTSYEADAVAGTPTPTYSRVGTPAPIVITSSNNKLDFDEGAGELTAEVTPGSYTPAALALALEGAIDSVASDEHTVTYSPTTFKFTLASDGAALTLKWATGTNTAETIGEALGFAVAADDSGALSYEADNQVGADSVTVTPGAFKEIALAAGLRVQRVSVATANGMVELTIPDSANIEVLEPYPARHTFTETPKHIQE